MIFVAAAAEGAVPLLLTVCGKSTCGLMHAQFTQKFLGDTCMMAGSSHPGLHPLGNRNVALLLMHIQKLFLSRRATWPHTRGDLDLDAFTINADNSCHVYTKSTTSTGCEHIVLQVVQRLVNTRSSPVRVPRRACHR